MSCIFLTRKCTMHCDYCAIRQSKLDDPELTPGLWIEVFKILEDLGIEFNLILGNEPLTLGRGLVDVVQNISATDYAFYTSAPEPLFTNLAEDLKRAGLRNLSCGYDYPIRVAKVLDIDQAKKTLNAHRALKWAKAVGISDYQGTATISMENVDLLPEIVQELDDMGIWVGYNFIHWAQDGGYDFFPSREYLDKYIIERKSFPRVEKSFRQVQSLIERGAMVQPPLEYLEDFFESGWDLSWHCSVPILSIDPDGHLRTCGYRRGNRTRAHTIFELGAGYSCQAFLDDWYKDMSECPGCYWSYPWMNEYWLARDPDLGKEVFRAHASKTARVK